MDLQLARCDECDGSQELVVLKSKGLFAAWGNNDGRGRWRVGESHYMIIHRFSLTKQSE